MKTFTFYLLCMISLLAGQLGYSQHSIWSIGTKDGSAKEFALAPGGYRDFLKNDFGYESKFYLVGYSKPAKDFPYVMPGPADRWGGTGPTSGVRNQTFTILFSLRRFEPVGQAELLVDLLDCQTQNPPVLKVVVNGKNHIFFLPKGGSEQSIDGNLAAAKPYTVRIPVAGILKPGGNEINISSIEGSWLIFDAIRLEAARPLELLAKIGNAYIRSVQAATYQLPEQEVQPLITDVQVVGKKTNLSVRLDGKTIFTRSLDSGRYELEVPMPAVPSATQSTYQVFLDGLEVESGRVMRSPQKKITVADYVDTYMGAAHSRWMIAPGPWMPFSMVKLSPDNQNEGWQAGYQPLYESVGTFSHIHEWTMAGLGMLPVNGKLITQIGDQSNRSLAAKSGYRSAIDKNGEQTPLGYYAVTLTDYNIRAELTATDRCGFHRYHFPDSIDGRVMIDLKIPAEYAYLIRDAKISQVDEYRVEGYSHQFSKDVWRDAQSSADQDYVVHFVIEFDQPIRKFGAWVNDKIVAEKTVTADAPDRFGAFVEFNTRKTRTVQARVGISYVSMEGARENLLQEITKPFNWDFDAVVNNNRHVWNDLISRITIITDDRREKRRFYTNMYRAFCRNTFSDVNGAWIDAAGKRQQFSNTDSRALGCDAFWNTFWNLNQLWNLAAPEWSSRWVRSQLAMYDANGWLAKGPAGMNFVPVMVAEHEIPLLVSAYQMGIRDYDARKLLEAVVKVQTTPAQPVGRGYAGNNDLEVYLKHHYVPSDLGRFSNSLEYSYDDWTVGQLAKALGNDNLYQQFNERGNWWRNVIDTATGFARLRLSNGRWEENFDPFKSGANEEYVEGNAWQLTYFVPHDVKGLATAIRKDRFLDRLSSGFRQSERWRYNAPGDQYWDLPIVQGNQQSMHFAFLFNHAGQPWKTQQWSRSIIDNYYGYNAGDAYLGDEDQGQMSAWFVMAAIGLFQTDGGCSTQPMYEIGSPLFREITIQLGNRYGRGRQFVIKANAVSQVNKFIQSARLNGKSLNSFHFPAAELLKGGLLELQMGSSPNRSFGTGE